MYIVVSLWDGRYLQLRGPVDWGYTDNASEATEFDTRKEAEETASRCLVELPQVLDQLD